MEYPVWRNRLGRAGRIQLSIELWSGIVANLDTRCVLYQLAQGHFQIE